MTGAERKRRWREKQTNREAEAEAHRARRTEQERLAEAVRDTLRYLRNQEQR
jgi:hypothetical protein